MNLKQGQIVKVRLSPGIPGCDLVPFEAMVVGFNREGEPIIQSTDDKPIKFRNQHRHVLDVPRRCIVSDRREVAQQAMKRESVISEDDGIYVIALTSLEYEAIRAELGAR